MVLGFRVSGLKFRVQGFRLRVSRARGARLAKGNLLLGGSILVSLVAEVAWLEKKGYQYTAVDISRWLRPAPAKGDPMTNRPHKLGRQMDSE